MTTYRIGDEVKVVREHSWGGRIFNDIPIGTEGVVKEVCNEGTEIILKWHEGGVERGNYIDVACIESINPSPEEIEEAIASIVEGRHD